MNHHPPGDEKPNPERYLKNTVDSFFFDVSCGIHKPKSYEKKQDSTQSTNQGREWARFWITTAVSILTLLAVAIYAWYAKLQWCEMKRTANSADQTVKEAQKQTAMLHQQLSESLGAIVFIQTYFEGGHSNEVRSGQNFTDFTFVNKGQVPAALACVEYEIRIDDVPRLHKYVLRRNHFESPVVLKEPPPGQGMPEDEDQNSSHRELFSLTEEQTKVLNHRDPTTHALVVEGYYEYWNGFDEKKTAPFCRVFSTVTGFAGNGESCSSFDSRWKKQ